MPFVQTSYLKIKKNDIHKILIINLYKSSTD